MDKRNLSDEDKFKNLMKDLYDITTTKNSKSTKLAQIKETIDKSTLQGNKEFKEKNQCLTKIYDISVDTLGELITYIKDISQCFKNNNLDIDSYEKALYLINKLINAYKSQTFYYF